MFHLFLNSSRLCPQDLLLTSDDWINDSIPRSNITANTSRTTITPPLSNQQQGHSSQIMNVMVPSVACPQTAAKKIRRKPENKVRTTEDNLNCIKTILITNIFLFCF